MKPDDAVIKPEKPKGWPACPNRTAVLVSSPADLKDIVKRAELSHTKPNVFLNSRMHCDPESPARACIAGPFIGAPYAVMLLESLVAWGIERVLLFGWCGAISPEVGVGDIIIPSSAFPGDGTTPNYSLSPEKPEETFPSAQLVSQLTHQCRRLKLTCRNAPVWTTDAVFRETPEIIEYYQEKGALAVEMETAAIFAAGAYRNIEVASVLAVSDELHTFTWQTGFGSNSFKKARQNAIELILSITRHLDRQCAPSAGSNRPE